MCRKQGGSVAIAPRNHGQIPTMLSLPLRTRLILSYLLVLMLGIGALVFWVGLRLQQAIIEEKEHELETEAFLIGLSLADQVKELDEDEGERDIALQRLRVFGDLVAQEHQRTVVIYNTAGRPLLTPETRISSLPSEVVSALSGKEQHAVRPNSTTGEPFLYVAVPLFREERLVGAVELGEPYALTRDEIDRVWTLLALSAGALILLGGGVAVWLARSITAPIQVLTQTATAIARGDLGRRTHLRTRDEIGQLARAFDHTADQLTLLLEQQRHFVADASHELRTPLTAIGLRAEALLSGAFEDPSVSHRYLSEIVSEAERMKQIIEDLLALSRFEAGLDQPQLMVVTVDELLKRALTSVAPLAEKAQVQIVTPPPPAGILVRVDVAQIQRALVNLLTNALKHSPPGGVITLAVQSPARPAQGSLHIWVHDAGPGIPPEHLPHLFKRFYRVDSARDRASGGTGLGLAITKAIVEAHGGRIWAESTPGAGATFHIVLPAEVEPSRHQNRSYKKEAEGVWRPARPRAKPPYLRIIEQIRVRREV